MFGLGKAKQEAWSGVVTRKGHGTNVDEDGERTPYWTLDVKRDDNGKSKHFVVSNKREVSPELYNELKEGDKVSKPAGQNNLVKA